MPGYEFPPLVEVGLSLLKDISCVLSCRTGSCLVGISLLFACFVVFLCSNTYTLGVTTSLKIRKETLPAVLYGVTMHVSSYSLLCCTTSYSKGMTSGSNLCSSRTTHTSCAITKFHHGVCKFVSFSSENDQYPIGTQPAVVLHQGHALLR